MSQSYDINMKGVNPTIHDNNETIDNVISICSIPLLSEYTNSQDRRAQCIH